MNSGGLIGWALALIESQSQRMNRPIRMKKPNDLKMKNFNRARY